MCAQQTNPVGLLEASKSPALQRQLKKARIFASTNESVCIGGETGTGKEILAQAIHMMSRRKDMPFVVVNCGAIPKDLIESELFGHAKGAFSGAYTARKGKFSEAHGGTIFLDEIGDLPLDQQVKLLRVLQDKRITPIGSNKMEVCDIRVIAATHRDLEKMVAEGTFREDLYYRLNVLSVSLPPLRERPEDISDLARHFMGDFLQENPDIPHLEFSPEVIHVMRRHSWGGNLRGLRNEVLCAGLTAHAEGRRIIIPRDVSFCAPDEPDEPMKGTPSIKTIDVDENDLALEMFSVRTIFDEACRVMKPAHLGIFSDIYLRHAENKLTLNQAAEKYNLSNNGTLKAHLSKAKKELKKHLRERFPGLDEHPVIRDYLYQTEGELRRDYPFYTEDVRDHARRHDPEQYSWAHVLLNRQEFAVISWCLSVPKGALKQAYDQTASIGELYKFSGLKTIAFKFSKHAEHAGQLEAAYVTPGYEKGISRELHIAR